MATAITAQALTTAVTPLFDSTVDGVGVNAYSVKNRSASAGFVLVTCAGLVTDFPLAAGDERTFRLGRRSNSSWFTTISVKAVSTATVDAGVVEKV